MEKNSIALFLLFIFYLCDVNAQQEPQFSHNMFNNMAINPGYAGLRNAICATALARQQWVGFRDDEGTRVNTDTYSFTVDAPLPFIRGGLGIGFIQDQIGFETSLGVRMAYSYHHDMDFGRLGIGAQIGFLDKRLDFTQFRPPNNNLNDPVLIGASGEESRMFTDIAIGTFYIAENDLWGGISFTQLAQPSKEIGNAMFQLKRHTYLTAGFHYTLPGQPAYVISPSTLVKTDFNSVQADINTLITYNNRFWTGVSYRLQDAAILFLGLNIEQISIGYSYDITTSPLGRNGRSFGSHEIFLRYCFNLELERVRETPRNVRFL
jgi:type IX secretion system PorP/SprF family membrane protein